MKSPRKALFLTLILLATVLQLPLAIGDPGWLAGWDYRVKITIDSVDVDEALTDFPVLIYISDSSGIDNDNLTFIFDELGAFDYLKIAITEDDGVTECYVEVEGWDSLNDKGWLWTKIPSISNVTDTEFYLYYDKDHADNTAYVGVTTTPQSEKVWDENFIMVYHMRDKGVDQEMWDSTDNDNDGNKIAINEPNMISGKIDKAQDFDGTGDYIDCGGDAGDLDITGALTIEAWVKPDSFADYQYVVGKGHSQYFIRFEMEIALESIRFFTHDGAYHRTQWDTNLATGVWYYVAGVMAGDGAMELFVDADSKDTESGGITSNAIDVSIGENLEATGRDLDGVIDEVRISNINRSNSWVKATYETGRDDFLDWGSEEEPPVLEQPDKLFGAGFNASSPYVSLYWKSNLTDITLFEVQNSTDGISWEYLGSNTTREYHDFQVVNGTERYYRVRACNFTDAVWENSTWTDINFETVYFIEAGVGNGAPAVEVAMGKSYALAIILLVLGLLIGTGMKRR